RLEAAHHALLQPGGEELDREPPLPVAADVDRVLTRPGRVLALEPDRPRRPVARVVGVPLLGLRLERVDVADRVGVRLRLAVAPLPHDELGTLRQRVVAAQLVVETDPGRRLHGLGRGRAGGHREHEHPDEHRRRPSPAHRPRVRLAYRGRMDGRDPEALVRQFHATYDVPVADGAASVATDRVHMRMALVAEEVAELVAAVYGARAGEHVATAFAAAVADDDGTRDVVAAADALADLVYVVYGMALECGIPLPEVLAEVHASNLSKLGADARPVHRADGKVLKGPSSAPPDVAGVLARSAERLTRPRRGPPRS